MNRPGLFLKNIDQNRGRICIKNYTRREIKSPEKIEKIIKLNDNKI